MSRKSNRDIFEGSENKDIFAPENTPNTKVQKTKTEDKPAEIPAKKNPDRLRKIKHGKNRVVYL